MHVQTDHQIIPCGPGRMVLADCPTGLAVVLAVRGDDAWTLKAEGTPDRLASTRDEAIDAMIDMALEILPGDGYSTLVPHGLRDDIPLS